MKKNPQNNLNNIGTIIYLFCIFIVAISLHTYSALHANAWFQLTFAIFTLISAGFLLNEVYPQIRIYIDKSYIRALDTVKKSSKQLKPIAFNAYNHAVKLLQGNTYKSFKALHKASSVFFKHVRKTSILIFKYTHKVFLQLFKNLTAKRELAISKSNSPLDVLPPEYFKELVTKMLMEKMMENNTLMIDEAAITIAAKETTERLLNTTDIKLHTRPLATNNEVSDFQQLDDLLGNYRSLKGKTLIVSEFKTQQKDPKTLKDHLFGGEHYSDIICNNIEKDIDLIPHSGVKADDINWFTEYVENAKKEYDQVILFLPKDILSKISPSPTIQAELPENINKAQL